MKWFKFYGGEYLSDPKIERLSPIERSCWLTILCMASMTDGVIEFLTVESLLNRSGIQFDPYHPEEWEKALSVLVKFEKLKMIETTTDGQIIVKNWEKRQEHNLTGAERVTKHRKNKADVTTNVTNVTPDKIRLDKTREEKKENTVVSDDTRLVAIDDEGNELVKVSGLRKPQRKHTNLLVWSSELARMKTSVIQWERMLVMYLNFRALAFESWEQWEPFKARLARPAKELVAFSPSKVMAAMEYANKNYDDWTLETVSKCITKV